MLNGAASITAACPKKVVAGGVRIRDGRRRDSVIHGLTRERSTGWSHGTPHQPRDADRRLVVVFDRSTISGLTAVGGLHRSPSCHPDDPVAATVMLDAAESLLAARGGASHIHGPGAMRAQTSAGTRSPPTQRGRLRSRLATPDCCRVWKAATAIAASGCGRT